MRRGFVRGLWADGKRLRSKTWSEVSRLANHPFKSEPLTTFVWGIDNAAHLRRYSFDPVEVSNEPYQFSGATYGSFWRHKLECWRLAAQLYDQFIWADFDTYPVVELGDNVWAEMAKGATLQASLLHYRKCRVTWRRTDQRKVMSAAFVYFGDNSIPGALVELANQHPDWSEELVMTYYVDQVLGHWPHTDDERVNVTAYVKAGHAPTCVRTRTDPIPKFCPWFEYSLLYCQPS